MGSAFSDRDTLRNLFALIVDLPPFERAEYLSDPAISAETREELRALLDADPGSDTFFEGLVRSDGLGTFGIGERFGPFETRQLLGRGGMGAVFKAERVDGELAQTVAIKVVERGWLDLRLFDRFRKERQFLAGLEHANIARLLDGGTRADGVVYLVMEYVDGLPLADYCDQHGLTIADRLRLFLPLCEAVDYAHAKLVIHRDLKPSNVLVTAAGEPKLLDFGIAKALNAAPGSETQSILLTPEFGSPEQACGEEATTRTDVYGLGSVLYFLLTGRAPHAFASLAPAELQRAICEDAPERPSSLRPELKGDIENILMKALHVEPSRRYHSARELAEDVEHYLAHRPVRATPDGRLYRANRFAQRNRFACMAGALAAVAIIAGIATSLYEAHRAQQRFAQVRELANHFVFDFEASIRDTPGTLAARRMVAATARQYLSSLSTDAGREASLDRELAQSYYRLSRVEMSAGESSASDEHLRKSIAILKSLKDDCCGPDEQHAEYITALTDLARLHLDTRSPDEARRFSAEALSAARAWYTRSPRNFLAERALVTALSTSGNVHSSVGQPREAEKDLNEAVHRSDDLLKRNPNDEDLGFARARAGHWQAGALSMLGEYSTARDAEDRSKEVLDHLLARHPSNTRWRNLRAQMATSTAAQLRRLAEKDPSLKPKILDASREAHTLAIENSRQSPGDMDLLDTALVMTTRLGTQLVREKRVDESLPLFREAAVLADQLVKGDPSSKRTLYLQANNRLLLGVAYGELKDWNADLSQMAQAEQLLQHVIDKWPSDLTSIDNKAMVFLDQSIALRHLGQMDAARQRCRMALDLAAQLIAKNKDAKDAVTDLDELRQEARILGIPDITHVK